MFEKLKKDFTRAYAVQKQQLDAAKNSNSLQAKKTNRKVGLIAFCFGIVVAFATFVGFVYTDKILILGVAVSLVCIFLGGYMAVTGNQKV